MIEPRGSNQILRRESVPSPTDMNGSLNLTEPLLQLHDASAAIHPELEYEVLSDMTTSQDEERRERGKQDPRKDVKLLLSFVFLILTGAASSVFAKLQAIPMYNYPNFVNLYANLIYIPICFAYIVPVARYGWFNNAISAAQLALPKRPFIVMGGLDCLATTMQIFASVYLPGPLLVLLPQAAIPFSMILSKYILGEKYHFTQYVGATVVLLGILVVLEPVVTHRHSPDFYCEATNVENDCAVCQVEETEDSCLGLHRNSDSDRNRDAPTWLWNGQNSSSNETFDDRLCQWLPFEEASREKEMLIFAWSFVMIASTVPMTLSTIYKQMALGGTTNLDPIFLNGWIAVFQFVFTLIVAVPAGMFSSPPVQAKEIPRNLWNGLKCYAGVGSVDTGCHPDSMCSFHAALFVNICLLCSAFYTFFMMVVLKYGSSSLLFLALTAMVPIGNLAFSLPFMPEVSVLHVSDLMGLLVIMTGLILYRFIDGEDHQVREDDVDDDHDAPDAPDAAIAAPPFDPLSHDVNSLREPLLSGDV